MVAKFSIAFQKLLVRLRRLRARFFRLFVDPFHAQPDSLTQIRTLSLFLLLLLPCLLAVSTWDVTHDAFLIYTYIGAGWLIIAYVLNRFGHYNLAAFILIYYLLVLPYIVLFTIRTFDAQRLMSILIFLVAPIMLTYLLSGVRLMIFTVFTVVISVLLLPYIEPKIQYDALGVPFFFLCVISGLIIISAIVRRHQNLVIAQQRESLIESEARFRDLFEASFDAVVVHNKGVIFDGNKNLEELAGLPLSELRGRNVLEFVMPSFREITQQQIERQSDEPYEAYMRSESGRIFPTEVRGKTRLYRGELMRVVSIRELSDRKQADARQFEVAVEREKVNVLQRFISNMSHDLRTPLTVIKTSAYLLTKLRNDEPKYAHQLDVLQGQVEHLQKLVDDLLSMSKLDKADTSDYKFKWADINAPVAQAIEDQRSLAQRREQSLVFNAGENLPQVMIDSVEFRRMVKHLILNGLGYSKTGGTVTISTQQAADVILLSVQDMGEGINPLDLPFILERFYRTDNFSQTISDGGTGLGLNIARKIAEAHGGSITVESEVGVGSTFTVRLPITRTDEPPLKADDEGKENNHPVIW